MKKAFSMIEMIFAIVIIGITVAGVSRMMTQNADTLAGSLSQEAVFLASMEAAKVFSHRWDANSKDATSNELAYSKIIDTNVSANYNRVCIDLTTGTRTTTTTACGANEILSVLRLGGIAEDKHRRFHSDVTSSAADTPAGVPDNSFDLNLTGEDGYKHNYGIGITSDYAGGAYSLASVGSSNIKRSEISIYDKDNGGNSLLVKMHVFSFNIGEFDYAKRTFQ